MDIKKANNSFFRQLLFIAVLVVMGLTIYYKLSFFTSSALGAIALYFVFRPLLFILTDKWKWRSGLASLTLVIISLIGLVGIGYSVIGVIANEIPSINTSALIEGINHTVHQINEYTGYELVSAKTIEQIKQILLSVVSGLLNTTYSVLANLMMMLVFLYFMFSGGRDMESDILAYFPFKGSSLELLKKEVRNMIYSNVIGIPIIMIFQGLFAAAAYWIFGLKNIAFWAFLTALFGLAPVIGATIIWLPLGVYLINSGQSWQGIVLIIYGIVIISNVDNVCRMILMSKIGNSHPLIPIMGVILGIPLFGFWGIIFGPLLISAFLLLVKIYYEEYKGNYDNC